MTHDELDLWTRAVHDAGGLGQARRPIAPPLFLSATFGSRDVADGVRLEEEKSDRFYSRYGNPTVTAVSRTIADLEGTESAVCFSSGMAAVTTTLFALLQAGDHIVVQREVYGGTHRFVTEYLPRFGVEVTRLGAEEMGRVDEVLRRETRLIYLESPTNPTLRLVDLAQVAETAERAGIPTIIDSTFATPVNCRPSEHGITAVLHSATKYLGGHSDLLGGVLCGPTPLVEKVHDTLRVFGAVLDPHAAYLLHRGIRTLGPRVAQQNETALSLARHLEDHPRVRRVVHPFLESHPQKALARRIFDGGGGVLSFEVDGGLDEATRFADGLELVKIAPSLGGVESLLSIPCLTSHAMLTPEAREEAGIPDGLVRLAVGIEATADLVRDVEQALAAI